MKRFILASVAALFCLPLTAQDMPKMFTLSWTKNAQYASITLNGYPVLDILKKENVSDSRIVNGFIMPGKNTLTIACREPALKSVTPFIEAVVRCYPKGKPHLAKNIVSFSRPQKNADGLAVANSFPFETTVEFVVDAPPVSKVWSEGSVMVLDAATMQKAREAIECLYTALKRRDGETFAERTLWSIRDSATALGENPERFAEQAKTGYPQLFAMREFKPVIPDLSKLEYTLMCGGKMLLVRRPGGVKAIDTGMFSQEICLSLIGGAMTVVRQ